MTTLMNEFFFFGGDAFSEAQPIVSEKGGNNLREVCKVGSE